MQTEHKINAHRMAVGIVRGALARSEPVPVLVRKTLPLKSLESDLLPTVLAFVVRYTFLYVSCFTDVNNLPEHIASFSENDVDA